MDKKRGRPKKNYSGFKKEFHQQTTIGLGDVVENITEKTGIKKVVESLFKHGEDCGCKERKEALNKTRIKFKLIRCFTEEQYDQWGEFMKTNPSEVTTEQQKELIIPIYKQLFARQLKPMSCCVKPYIEEINKVYERYQ